jgi:hypothetical protein
VNIGKTGFALVSGIGALAAILIACADTDPDTGFVPDRDGPPPLPTNDAGSSADGAIEAAAEAGVSKCSPGGFCHTDLPPDSTLTAVWGDGAGVVWAISEQGKVLRWETDAWKVHATGLGALRAIWAVSPTDIWLGGAKGLFHGTGATSAALVFAPETVPGDANVPVSSIWGAGPDDLWAVGGRTDVFPYENRVLHRSPGDAGPVWSLVDVSGGAAAPLSISHVWGNASSGVWLAGVFFNDEEFFDDGVMLRRAAGSTTFDPIRLPSDPIDDRARLGRVGAISTTATTMLVVGRSSTDAPSTWRAITSDGGQTFTWTFARGSSSDFGMNAAFDLGATDGWAAGDLGRLRRWDGTAWSQASVTYTGIPVTKPFHGMWGAPAKDLWVVGEQIAVHRDLSKP